MASAKIFLFTHKKLNNGSYPVVLQIIMDRKRKLISLGHSATLPQWDIEENKPTKKHPNYRDLMLLIQKKLYQANKIIMEFDEADKPYTIEDIIVKLKSGKSSSSVFKYTEEFIKKLEKIGKTGNATIYTTTLNVFKKFRNDKMRKKSTLVQFAIQKLP